MVHVFRESLPDIFFSSISSCYPDAKRTCFTFLQMFLFQLQTICNIVCYYWMHQKQFHDQLHQEAVYHIDQDSLGRKIFHFRVDPFSKIDWCTGKETDCKRICLPCKNAGNTHQVHSFSLILCFPEPEIPHSEGGSGSPFNFEEHRQKLKDINKSPGQPMFTAGRRMFEGAKVGFIFVYLGGTWLA